MQPAAVQAIHNSGSPTSKTGVLTVVKLDSLDSSICRSVHFPWHVNPRCRVTCRSQAIACSFLNDACEWQFTLRNLLGTEFRSKTGILPCCTGHYIVIEHTTTNHASIERDSRSGQQEISTFCAMAIQLRQLQKGNHSCHCCYCSC